MENDYKIKSLLLSDENDILSKMNILELKYLLHYLNKYYLEYRDTLNISSDITFGVEIELEHFKGTVADLWPFECEINKIIGNKNWTIKNDITLLFGRELATEVYTDKEKTWKDIDNVCEYASGYLEVGEHCAGHVNIGSQILSNDALYWYRFLKLWSIYENVIYRFSYGEYLSYFPYMTNGSKPVGKLILDRLDYLKDFTSGHAHELIVKAIPWKDSIGFLKKNGISFYKMLDKLDYSKFEYDNVLEIRSPISTLDPVVWQNYISFFVHLLLYCKSDKYDDDILERRMRKTKRIVDNIDNYDNIYLDQALELSDMIFDNNLDKIYFLRQYLKNFDVSSERFKKAKKFTLTKN